MILDEKLDDDVAEFDLHDSRLSFGDNGFALSLIVTPVTHLGGGQSSGKELGRVGQYSNSSGQLKMILAKRSVILFTNDKEQ